MLAAQQFRMISRASANVNALETVDDLLRIVDEWENRYSHQAQAFPSIWYRGLAEFAMAGCTSSSRLISPIATIAAIRCST